VRPGRADATTSKIVWQIKADCLVKIAQLSRRTGRTNQQRFSRLPDRPLSSCLPLQSTSGNSARLEACIAEGGDLGDVKVYPISTMTRFIALPVLAGLSDQAVEVLSSHALAGA
jgi:hypothetical protein